MDLICSSKGFFLLYSNIYHKAIVIFFQIFQKLNFIRSLISIDLFLMHFDLGVDVPRPMVGKNNVSGNWMENETTDISSSVSDAGQFGGNWLL